MMTGTDMDYESAAVIAAFILAEMPYHRYEFKSLADLPARIGGYPAEWVMKTLTRAGVTEEKIS